MFKLVELAGLDGTKLLINVGSIALFKYIRHNDFGIVTKVDYAGRVVFTRENPENLIERMPYRDMFGKFTVRSSTPVWINIMLISGIRKSIISSDTGTEIVVGGLDQHIADDIDYVLHILKSVQIYF